MPGPWQWPFATVSAVTRKKGLADWPRPIGRPGPIGRSRCNVLARRGRAAACISHQRHFEEWALGCQHDAAMLRSPIPVAKLLALQVANCAQTQPVSLREISLIPPRLYTEGRALLMRWRIRKVMRGARRRFLRDGASATTSMPAPAMTLRGSTRCFACGTDCEAVSHAWRDRSPYSPCGSKIDTCWSATVAGNIRHWAEG